MVGSMVVEEGEGLAGETVQGLAEKLAVFAGGHQVAVVLVGRLFFDARNIELTRLPRHVFRSRRGLAMAYLNFSVSRSKIRVQPPRNCMPSLGGSPLSCGM